MAERPGSSMTLAYVVWIALALATLPGCAQPPIKFPDPPPRRVGLWRVTIQSDNPLVAGTYETCSGEGAPPVNEQLRTVYEIAKKSCRVAESRGSDGSFIEEDTCNLANQRTSGRTVETYPSATHTHDRIELRSGGPLPWQRTMTWIEHDSNYVGVCPAGLLPGQRLLPSGFVVDPSRLARGHFTLGSAQDAAISVIGKGLGSSPLVTPEPLAPVSLSRRAYISCRSSSNGTKWGSLRFDEPDFPFGQPTQSWRVLADLGVSARGEHMLIWDVQSPQDNVGFYDEEPNFTVRLGSDYIFTPPIAQQAYVLGKGGAPLTREAAQTRDAAQKQAEARGETYCFVNGCFPSDTEKQTFVQAFDETAAAGGDMTISGPGPNGPITLRYSLKGLNGIWTRLERCTV